jgi:hypothetical protein
MNEDRLRNYLLDLGSILREKAVAAKHEKQQNGEAYNIGYLMALHEVVSIMQSQADQFGIALDEIGLDGINPEVDLL